LLLTLSFRWLFDACRFVMGASKGLGVSLSHAMKHKKGLFESAASSASAPASSSASGALKEGSAEEGGGKALANEE